MRHTLSTSLGLLGLLVSATAGAEDLLELYQQAQRSDPQLRAAEAAYQAASEGRPLARSSLLPQINLSANIARSYSDIKQPASAEKTYTTTGYSLSLSQALYHKDYYVQLEQADTQIAQAAAQRDAADQGLLLRTADAYFSVLRAQDNLASAQAEKKAVEQQLKQTKQRFDVGLIAITDVHEAQARYDATVAAEIVARNAVDTAREGLREITATIPDSLAKLNGEMPLLTPEPANIDEWVETALAENLSLIATRASVTLADQTLQRVSASSNPTLDLVASHAYSDQSDVSASGVEGNTTSVAIQFSLPLYTGGRITAQSRQARAQLVQAQEGLDQQVRATEREVRSAYLGVLAAKSQVQALKQSLASAQTALRATEAGFEVGTRTAVDVLDSQRALYAAQSNYAGARYDYLIATLALKQAAGTLALTDLEAINQWLD